MKLIFGDLTPKLKAKKPQKPRLIRLYDIERDGEGMPVAMYWRGDFIKDECGELRPINKNVDRESES